AGYFMTFVGIFRWMDLTGVKAYHTVMKNVFPTLFNGTEDPKLIDDVVKDGGNGVSNAKGFDAYTPEEAKLWEETFSKFTYQIRELALQYPAHLIAQKLQQSQDENLSYVNYRWTPRHGYERHGMEQESKGKRLYHPRAGTGNDRQNRPWKGRSSLT